MKQFSENQKANNRKKHYYIKWGNVALAFTCLTLVFVLVYELFVDDHELTVVSTNNSSVSSSEEFSKKDITSKVEVSSNSTRLSQKEFDILVLAVQHEVGKTPEYFPTSDFDKIQQAMASVIVNRIGDERFGQTLEEVLNQENQFTGLLDDINHPENFSNSDQLDVNDARTRENCLAVLNKTSDLHNKEELLFERCSLGEEDLQEAWSDMQSGYISRLFLHYSFKTADGRYIMFAGIAE